LVSLSLSVSYYRLGGWRKVRLGLARTAPVPRV
jgi:hypothetical protein